MRVDAPPFGSVGGRASVIAKVSFIFPPRYSVLALLVLTSPLVSTTQPQGIISDTPQDFAGCLRLCLRLCLRVAKIRTFAPLLVSLHCAETIALLSDFCSAGLAAHAALFACLGSRSRTPSTLPHPRTEKNAHGVPAESIFGGVKLRPCLFRSYTRTHVTLARRVRRAQA